MIIEAFGKTKEYKENQSLVYILKDLEPLNYKNYFCARINNKLYELKEVIHDDAKIEFLDLKSRDAMHVYQSSLRFIFVYAVKSLFPDARVIFNYSISRSIFCQLVGVNEKLDLKLVTKIDNKIRDIINQDLPIKKIKITKDEASLVYSGQNFKSKVKLLKYRSEDYVNAYQINDYINYMYNYLVPSTGFINDYRLNLYSPGIIMQYPRSEIDGKIPDFKNESVMGKYLKDANKWGQITNASYISDLNNKIETDDYKELINLCETRHNNMLAELGKKIQSDIENIKLIAVAGPSSSGKTTFTNRLRIELLSRGISPLMISLDNYYLEDSGGPKDKNGEPDYEHIEALDLKLFNEQILDLIEGESVVIPIFDFITKKRIPGPEVKLGKNQPILIEGIHALNERLTESIPSLNKYKIYIAPHAQLHIDAHTPISMTDIRLIRRLVRDYKYRNSDPEETLKMWPSVRRGEFKWIYPYQENADFVFNSELTYELAVLKKPCLEVLSKVSKDCPNYILANKLIKILKYFKEIDDRWIPCNSIIREFIGGSIFYEK